MTTLPHTPLGELDTIAEQTAAKRAAVVQGLRDAAALLEADPRIPTPKWTMASYSDFAGDMTLEDFTLAHRALGGIVAVDGCEAVTQREFPGRVVLQVATLARNVCVPREVTTTEMVLPAALTDPAPTPPRFVISQDFGLLGEWVVTDTLTGKVRGCQRTREQAEAMAARAEAEVTS